MARILVTEEIADGGLERLRQAGHTVDIQLDLSHEQLLSAVKGAHALIIRSATDVNAEVLEAGTDLVVVGRAGVGLDNVDVDTATRRGVMVCNAPESNIVSAAEQTMALLLAVARNVPQAHAALVQGRWERSKWEGVELADKTLGVIGLGRIGTLVAQRLAGFGVTLIGYDPYVTQARAEQIGVELGLALKAISILTTGLVLGTTLINESVDHNTIHTASIGTLERSSEEANTLIPLMDGHRDISGSAHVHTILEFIDDIHENIHECNSLTNGLFFTNEAQIGEVIVAIGESGSGVIECSLGVLIGIIMGAIVIVEILEILVRAAGAALEHEGVGIFGPIDAIILMS